MIEPIHTRNESWEGWPFASVADVAKYAVELEALVREAGGENAPWISIEIQYGDREYQLKSIEEFDQAAKELDLETLHSLTVMILWEDFDPVNATFTIEGGAHYRTANLRVNGRRGTAVDGVKVGAKAAVDRWADKTRAAEEARESAAPRPGDDAPASPPAWRRFLDHPYSVQIIGGAVGSVIAAVILVLVLR